MSKGLQVAVYSDHERWTVQKANVAPKNAVQNDIVICHLGVRIHSDLKAPNGQRQVTEASKDQVAGDAAQVLRGCKREPVVAENSVILN
jgi:hypothetical protein